MKQLSVWVEIQRRSLPCTTKKHTGQNRRNLDQMAEGAMGAVVINEALLEPENTLNYGKPNNVNHCLCS